MSQSRQRVVRFLLHVDNIDTKRSQPTQKTCSNLAYKHRTRIKVNRECMEIYIASSAAKLPTVYIPRNIHNPKTQNVKFAKGMP